MKTKKVKLEIYVIIDIQDGVDVEEVLQEMDYGFKSNTVGANIIDTRITNQDILN